MGITVIRKKDEFQEITRPGLKELALKVFGTTDGMRPLFPRSGEKIQEALERAYDLGKSAK